MRVYLLMDQANDEALDRLIEEYEDRRDCELGGAREWDDQQPAGETR